MLPRKKINSRTKLLKNNFKKMFAIVRICEIQHRTSMKTILHTLKMNNNLFEDASKF